MPLKTGDWIDGRYRIIRPLGKGSEGSVYLAVQESIYKFYAVKILEKHGVCFSKESIELWKRLSHPGLPEIADIIEKNGKIYLVMDYVEGCTLNEVVESGQIPSVGIVISWGIRICEILEYLHNQNPPIIFGDLKPSNLVLQKENVVLVDFGSAAMLCSKGPRSGTVRYFPPWSQRERADMATDIYGLGKTLEFLVSGGSNSYTAPKELKRIIESCTSMEDGERYRTVKECRLALERMRSRGWQLMAMILLTLCVTLMAARTLSMENIAANDEVRYEELLVQAETGLPEEQRELFAKAICLKPSCETGYLKLLDYFLEDAQLSEEEDMCLRTVLREGEGDGISNEKRLQENEAGYIRVCYEIGIAYWYFYQGEGGKTYAGKWFRKVLEASENEGIDKKRRMRSAIYEKISGYRAKLVRGGRSGETSVSYREYWEDLAGLLDIPEEEVDSVIVNIYIWKEILLQMSHYTLEFKNAGVSEEEMRSVLENIRNEAEEVKVEGKAVKEEKEEMGRIMETLRETLDRMEWEEKR